MKNLSLIAFMMLLLYISACNTKQDNTEESAPGAREIPALTDVAGSFKGDMPCNNCDKEIVTLQFLMDKTVFKTAAQVNGEGSTATVGTWDLEGSEVSLNINDVSESYQINGKKLEKRINGKVYSLNKLEEK